MCMQDFYRCAEGYLDSARAMAYSQCPKLVKDMLYEARIQAVIVYNATVNKRKVTKREARNMVLTPEQYEMVNIELSLIQMLTMHNLKFLYLLHLMMCRCLRGGVLRICQPGELWWPPCTALPIGRRGTMRCGSGV